MRSRFTAFAVGDASYLLRTWDPLTRPPALDLDTAIRWKRLAIVEVSSGSVTDSVGTVEFTASYVAGGIPGILRELSSFRRIEHAWFYVGPLG